MSELTPHDRAGQGSSPSTVAFNPDARQEVPLDASELGTVILLLVGEVDRRWAADTAVSLCAEWARSGRRVVLADLHLETPILHEVAGTDNLEGIADVFLYGASISRSARPVRGQGFYLISAGTYEPDSGAVYRHARWPKVVAGFRDAGASLVLFAPERTADVEALARWTDDALLLGSPSPTLPALLAEHGIRARAMLLPPEAPPEEPAPAPAAQRAAPAQAPVAHDRELLLPPEPVRPQGRTGRGARVALGVLLAVALLAALGFLVGRMMPDLAPWGATEEVGAEPVVPTAEPAPAPDAANRAGASLPYSVQVRAYTSLPAAQEQLVEERGRAGGTLFFISPEEIQGVLYYKILAGLEADTVAASALRERLVQIGAVDEEEAVGSWSLLQFTPLAFDLGEFETSEQAASALDSLQAREVPAYSVPVPYSDGSRRWQLYGGAYRDSASAEAMRQRLDAAGVQPRLVARIGEPPAPPPRQP